MKRKDYEKLLDKIEEANLVYGGWVLEHADYNEVRQPLSFKESKIEMEKSKKILDGYKAELEDILTVDMETFAEDILKYINETHEEKYEIVTYDINGEKLWVASPINKTIISTNQMIYDLEDVYTLGKNDKKILPIQALDIKGMTFPTISSNNKYFAAYHVILGALVVRYDKFDDFMEQYENKLVEAYVPKKRNKR